jgi:hypothetical protein
MMKRKIQFSLRNYHTNSLFFKNHLYQASRICIARTTWLAIYNLPPPPCCCCCCLASDCKRAMADKLMDDCVDEALLTCGIIKALFPPPISGPNGRKGSLPLSGGFSDLILFRLM